MMLNPHSTGSIQWSGVPSVGALQRAFTNDWDLLQWNWPNPPEITTNGEESGQANFLTRVEVTGELSLAAQYTAVCRVICLFTLSRLSENGLREACRALSDIYSWEQERNQLHPTPTIMTRKRSHLKPAKITHTKRKPFVFDED
jgi:hypothetical protein